MEVVLAILAKPNPPPIVAITVYPIFAITQVLHAAKRSISLVSQSVLVSSMPRWVGHFSERFTGPIWFTTDDRLIHLPPQTALYSPALLPHLARSTLNRLNSIDTIVFWFGLHTSPLFSYSSDGTDWGRARWLQGRWRMPESSGLPGWRMPWSLCLCRQCRLPRL